MRKSILMKIGDSAGLVVPAALRRELGWWQGDVLTQEIHDGALLIRNATQRGVRHIHTQRQDGEIPVNGTKRPI